MELIILRILMTAALILATIYGIKKFCGVGILDDFPEDLKGIRWFLAQTNIFFAIVVGSITTDLVIMPIIQKLFG
ncbi:hypothetical protein [Planctobacterium marinum]|uniref:Uncharacterized protein n=1 Tax=Planctobacterium marinum TaxID=1631968 RepID=A0AA48HU32_9ALTE|nr:hypothetical protein MACH26_35150 [Planctobacterium marinum]